MNREVLEKWAQALEGGKYPLDGKWLKTDKGYDAWGVLCELYVVEKKAGHWVKQRREHGNYAFYAEPDQRGPGDVGFAPKQVTDWLGLGYDDEGAAEKLAFLLDYRRPFADHALAIRALL